MCVFCVRVDTVYPHMEVIVLQVYINIQMSVIVASLWTQCSAVLLPVGGDTESLGEAGLCAQHTGQHSHGDPCT